MFVCGLIGMGIDYFNLINFHLGDVLSNISFSLIVTSIIIFIGNDLMFHFWLKFFCWWFVISVVFIFISPAGIGGFFPSMFTKELVSLWVGIVLVLMSLFMIIRESYKSRKQ